MLIDQVFVRVKKPKKMIDMGMDELMASVPEKPSAEEQEEAKMLETAPVSIIIFQKKKKLFIYL